MKKTLKYIIPFFVGCLFIPIPLLGDFHFESAILAGTLGCFLGGIISSRLILKKDSIILFKVLRSIYLFGLPLLLFSLFRNCLIWDGVGFWLLIPIPSVLFGISIGRFFRKIIIPFPALFTVFTLFLFGLGVLLFEFLTLPQVYFYNHVWGAWPGPIYDETVRVTLSFVYFRGFTFGWILLFWFLPEIKSSKRKRSGILLTATLLAIGYWNLPVLGISSPTSYLKTQLPMVKQTEHFDLYFDTDYFSEEEINYWTLKHEFHFQQIIKLLEIDWPVDRKIESFLYANAWQKKELVGAKFTSYVPIWLKQDQLHIAKQHLDDVLKHELVHVISKRFGNSLFNGSWSIGLIEGLAEGIARDASPESTLDQILAADPPYPNSSQMKNALSFSGFYSSAGSISYSTAGSFVGYLLKNYPVSNFKKAYSSSSFDEAYSISFDSLVSKWHRSLPASEIDSVDQQVSNAIFSQRSIFQKTCPHKVTPLLELWDTVQFYESNNNAEKAFPIVEELYQMAPDNLIIKRKWLTYKLEQGDYGDVISSIPENDSIPAFGVLKADAFAMLKNWDAAYNQFEKTWELLPRSYKYSLELRKDTLNWGYFNSVRYDKKIPIGGDLGERNYSNQLVAIQTAIELIRFGYLASYSASAWEYPLNTDWFGTYEVLIDRLIFLNEFSEAEKWIEALSQSELRPRYKERLQEQREWFNFSSNN